MLNLLSIWTTFFAILLIFSSNSIYAVLSLILVILSACTVLILLQVEFLAFILILIYVGAISVLFLFIVMLLQIPNVQKNLTNLNESSIIYSILGLKAFFFFSAINKKWCLTTGVKTTTDIVNIVGQDYLLVNTLSSNISKDIPVYYNTIVESATFLSLFLSKSYLFGLLALLLLFSMVGSIILCIKPTTSNLIK